MHQTFYIDIDEEITSIVDRLRKAKAKEVVLVVPKSALLTQSIVNLKLLKKESDNLKIQIMIVTQDKLGRLLIEKAGILVQNKLDESLEDEVVVSPKEDASDSKGQEIKEKAKSSARKSHRLDRIGTESYFSPSGGIKKDDLEIREEEGETTERITHKELVTHSKRDLKKKGFFGKKRKSPTMDIAREVELEEDIQEEKKSFPTKTLSPSEKEREMKLASFFKSGFDPKEKEEENLSKKVKMSVQISGKFWKSFLVFGGVSLLVLAFLGAYLFLPKAEVKIFSKIKTQTESFEVKGRSDSSSLSIENETVPIKLVETEEEFSGEFPSSGQKSVSNQKARGKITIYNEFSSSSQPLVATTRFVSEDGKLFRLAKGVTIPGMEGGTPGKIEAEVVADESGASFNIGPSKFTIPGFKSSGEDKFNKFYAKSEVAMIGGGNGNEEIRSITQGDIDNAKAKMSSQLGQNGRSKIIEKAGPGWVVLDEAINSEGAEYVISGTAGEIANNFTVTVKVRHKALVFREDDIKNLVAGKASQKSSGYAFSAEDVSMDFGKTDADFSASTLIIRFQAVINSGANLDLDNIKRGILGKDEEELKDYLESYPEIEKVEVEYWPSFWGGKIPMYEKRVDIRLDK